MKADQKQFFEDIRDLPDTGRLGKKQCTLYTYCELLEFAQSSEAFTTIQQSTRDILTSYGFKAAPYGIGWKITE
jgi:hypothetical protein